ncbi:MAG TPA: hypothetical protein DCZ94_21150 [Lentisphaeria bacterium]|nr:MAG: hypothetical protein A2X48_16615 [Lentisphaerae bacterium GWF2_49_21]HBC89453.1 hypothetical protein [Lentisphaeria bacterium]
MMKINLSIILFIFCLANVSTGKEEQAVPSASKDKFIGVFVSLADNKNQGIVPVPEAIGNGDDPEKNLYWGTADGLKGFFDKSKRWKLLEKQEVAKGDVLRTRTYRLENSNVVLFAQAYRGTAIRKCIQDFELAVQSGTYDLVVYIGHNGLMDFNLPLPEKSGRQAKIPDCIVLCCKSEAYFKTRLEKLGGHPLLMTTQFMYPGSFIVDAIVENWINGDNPGKIRESAGVAYSKNQKISAKSAVGVFSEIKE